MVSWAENKRALKTDAPSMYAQMCGIWESIGESPNRKMGLSIFDMSYNDMIADNHSATIIEDSDKVKVTDENRQQLTDYKSLLTKSSTVDFVPDTSEFLTPNEAYEILDEFIEIAKVLDGAIIQIEGNINASNYSESGVKLSLNRANAVADYFIMNGIDPDRIITVGNGNTKMLAEIGSGNEQLNRRTDVFFKIVED
jgi:outer membrane protein OmpA-like peptidoglycan-associated protein